jgi:pyruvate formate lyase activating enzyme
MLIAGWQKISFNDYPEKLTSILFTAGCNMRCPYCHNYRAVLHHLNTATINEEIIFDYLRKRQGKIDAVTISGGEPTIHRELPDFIQKIKTLGYLVKLDTNGTNPKMLQKLIDDKLVDYVAMDIKAPWNKYQETVGSGELTEKIIESKRIILKTNNGLDYEFRTTVVKEQLNCNDIEQMAKEIKGAKRYFLQKFTNNDPLSTEFKKYSCYSEEKMKNLSNDLGKRYIIEECTVRGW